MFFCISQILLGVLEIRNLCLQCNNLKEIQCQSREIINKVMCLFADCGQNVLNTDRNNFFNISEDQSISFKNRNIIDRRIFIFFT